MPNPGLVLFGEKELRKALGHIGKTASRTSVRSGLSVAMTVMAREMRRQVSATTIPKSRSARAPKATSLKQGARKAVGRRFEKARTGQPLKGLVGFGVGRKGGRRKEVLSKGETKGAKAIHVTARNIHWFVLGAHIFGKHVMPPYFTQVVPKALAAKGEVAMVYAVQKVKQRLLKEAEKEYVIRKPRLR